MEIDGIDDTELFFRRDPNVLAVFNMLFGKIMSLEGVSMTVGKTQISFRNRHGFAYVWLPNRKVRGRPDSYLIVSFGLGRRVTDDRVVESAEPYPGRWTHHVIIQNVNEVDDVLMGWIKESYDFSMDK